MTIEQATTVDSWADGAYLDARSSAPPVDLHAIARLQKIAWIKLRLIIQEGALVPVPRGFEVYIQSLKPVDLSVQDPERIDFLTNRQRFTLAHEIVHTRFYKSDGGTPQLTGKVRKKQEDPDDVGVEEICDRAAGRLLVPTQVLKSEIRNALNNDCERIDAQFVGMMARRFRVSYEVMIGRLRSVEPGNVFARCIALIRRIDGDYRLVAWYVGQTLLPTFPRLKEYLYKPFREFLPDLTPSVLGATEIREHRFSINGHDLLFRKLPAGNKTDFLLQIDDPAHRAPNSDQA